VLQIHRFVLEKSEHLVAAPSVQNEVDLSSISGMTGHVLVGYLYTGTLEGTKDLPVADVLPAIFGVYAAAKRFRMSDLRQATQTEIESHTSSMNPSEAITAIKKACPLPDVADTWLRNHSKTLLDAAFDDVTSFLASDIMADEHAESTISITEMLLRAMICSAKEKTERELKRQQAAGRKEQARIKGLCEDRDRLERKEKSKKKKNKLTWLDQVRLGALRAELALIEESDQKEPAENNEELEESPESEEPGEGLYANVEELSADEQDDDFWRSTRKPESGWSFQGITMK